jgi:hypothetical protein
MLYEVLNTNTLETPKFEHKLGEQELSMLTSAQQAIAKDWNLTNQKTDWLITQLIEIRKGQSAVAKLVLEHAEAIRLQRTVLKIVGWFIPSGLIFLGAIYWLVRYIRSAWRTP